MGHFLFESQRYGNMRIKNKALSKEVEKLTLIKVNNLAGDYVPVRVMRYATAQRVTKLKIMQLM